MFKGSRLYLKPQNPGPNLGPNHFIRHVILMYFVSNTWEALLSVQDFLTLAPNFRLHNQAFSMVAQEVCFSW